MQSTGKKSEEMGEGWRVKVPPQGEDLSVLLKTMHSTGKKSEEMGEGWRVKVHCRRIKKRSSGGGGRYEKKRWVETEIGKGHTQQSPQVDVAARALSSGPHAAPTHQSKKKWCHVHPKRLLLRCHHAPESAGRSKREQPMGVTLVWARRTSRGQGGLGARGMGTFP